VRGLATVLVLLAMLATAHAQPAIPDRLDKLISTHCRGCHDSTHDFDLTKLPAATDHRTWAKILDKVAAQAMPPPDTKTVAGRFPLDPATRLELVGLLEDLAAGDSEFAPAARFISAATWAKAVNRFVGATLPAKDLEPVLGRVADEMTSTTGRMRRMSAVMQLAIDRGSVAVCEKLAAVPGVVPASREARAAAIDGFEKRLFGEAKPRAVARSAALYEQLAARYPDAKRAWTIVCTTYLSGPRLLYGGYLKVRDE